MSDEDLSPEAREAREDAIRAALEEAGHDPDGRWGMERLEAYAKEKGVEIPQVVIGGAQIERVEVQPVAPAVDGDDTIKIITTAPGTLGPGGIVPAGTKVRIKESAFSKEWMKRI